MEDTSGSAFWAGYRDCGEQAIDFLLQSGTVAEDDPLIQGLRSHLREKAEQLASECPQDDDPAASPPATAGMYTLDACPRQTSLVSNTDLCRPGEILLNASNDDEEDIMEFEQSMDEGYNSSINTSISDLSSVSDLSVDLSSSSHDLSLEAHSSPVSSSVSVSEVFALRTHLQQQQQRHLRAQTVTVDTFTPIMHHQVMSPVTGSHPVSCGSLTSKFAISNSRTESRTPGAYGYPALISAGSDSLSLPQDLRNIDPFRDPVGLALLAQNNPEIASVAQELLELLSEDCEDELLEESDSEDMKEDIVYPREEDVVDSHIVEEDVVKSEVVNEDEMNLNVVDDHIVDTAAEQEDIINVETVIEDNEIGGITEENGNHLSHSRLLRTGVSSSASVNKEDLSSVCVQLLRDIHDTSLTTVLCTADNKENTFTSTANYNKTGSNHSSPRQLSPLQVKTNN